MKMTLCTQSRSYSAAFVAAVFIVGALHCQQKITAAEQLQKVSQNIRQAKKAEDMDSYLRESQQMYRLLNGSPSSTAQLMLAEAAAGLTSAFIDGRGESQRALWRRGAAQRAVRNDAHGNGLG